ncbi:MAG: hypothetical protein MR388_05095 [Tenericutes bacterium]|nr:hypothetical protein [Mycoplasmatota bacterium]
MKKLVILILCFFMTGCSIVRIDTTNVDNIVKVVLSKENNLYNRVGKGYKYYIPRGVSYLDTTDLNDKLYSDGIYYYLYIDIVSYYHKIDMHYEEDPTLYYSKKIDGEKTGYLQIEETNDYYYVTFYYNYAKIEAITQKSKLEEVILNASYILSTVKFNDNIVALNLKDDYFTNKEEQYTEFKESEKEEYFLSSTEESNEN